MTAIAVPPRTPLPRLAWLLAGVTYLLIGGTLGLIWLRAQATGPGIADWGDSSPVSTAIWVLPQLTLPTVGAAIAARQPRNVYGWVWLANGLGAVSAFAQAYALYGLVIAPGSLPLATWALIFEHAGWSIWFGTVPFLLLLFPTGHPPSRRWRPVAWAVIGAVVCEFAVGWAIPGERLNGAVDNPFAVHGSLGQVIAALSAGAAQVILAGILLGVISLVIRYQRAGGTERQQLKWLALGAAFLGLWLSSGLVVSPSGIWVDLSGVLAFAALPVAVGIAILRYRLYDIDVLIRKTLVYGALTALLALAFLGSVVVLQRLSVTVTGQESPVATVASTLAIAALFAPLRRRVQAFIDRRFYRQKYDAQQMLARFAAAARDETDVDRLAGALAEAVQKTMQPAHLSLWLKRPASSQGRDRA